MKTFEYLEHTADIKFRSYGSTLKDLFENSAKALFNAMIDTSTVKENEKWILEITADDLEELTYSWLSELLFLFEVEYAVFSSFDVKLHKDNGTWRIYAEIYGEKIDLARHFFDCEVKAVTLHEFEVIRNDGWMAQVILDV